MTEKKKQCVALDFDGTLHEYYGWTGEGVENLNPPMPGVVQLIHDLITAGREVVIFSAREAETIRHWLRKYHLPELEVTNIKLPKFDVIIDDRAMNFDPWYMSKEEYSDFLESVLDFQPHYKYHPKYIGKREY